MNSNSSSNNDQPNISNSTGQIKNNPEKSSQNIKSPISPICSNQNLDYVINALKNNRKKTENKITKPQNLKLIKDNYLFSVEYVVHKNLHKKYNYTQKKYNLLCINYLLSNASCHLVSIFKEKMIIDYIDEFLRRKYSFKESKERIPRFYLYYKHYSIFFGLPFFTDFPFNIILQKNGERKARIYYKNHYQNGESKDEDNENMGFAESGSDDDEEDKKINNNTNKKKKNKISNNMIFNSGIKENIDNVTLMTTINSIENNTINLGLNNERIEIFSENKMEKSNDTTIGEIMDDINKGIEEAKKVKNNKNVLKKNKNYSSGENIYNLMKKNINNNDNKENFKRNKKKLMDLLNNNNNIKKKIKKNSIKKKLFYVGHQNINLNGRNSTGTPLTCNTHRYSKKKDNLTLKDNLNKKNNNPNNNLASNKTYKKRKLLSYGNEELNKMTNPNILKIRKRNNNTNSNINSNHSNTINTNTIDSYKKLNYIQKINSPFSINKKTLNSNNTNNNLSNINDNNKIKISKTLKNFANKNKKNVPKTNFNKDLFTISGDKKKNISKFSYKKLDINNLTETQIFKEKNVNKKAKGRNIISPLNNKYFENYTLDSDYTNTNNLPFSENKNKNTLNNNKIFSNRAILNNLSYQTINYEQGAYHQRTKSNFIQNNFKNTINNNPTFSKVIITDSNNAYIKPAIRIKKNDKLFKNKPILIDTNPDNNYENRISINNNVNNISNKKLTKNSNDNYLNNFTINNTNISNEFKNNIIHNNNIKNTNFNKYILDVIKKSKHQHYNSLTNQNNLIHTLNTKDSILLKNKKKLNNNSKENTDRDVVQIALSLYLNESTSRNAKNNTNIMEHTHDNLNNLNTYYKINNNKPVTKNNNNNNPKRNYNLNININNEININENNTINNSSYSINDLHKLKYKNLSRKNNIHKNNLGNESKQKDKEKDKYIINLKQKKSTIEPNNNANRINFCKSSKNNNIKDIIMVDINSKRDKKIKTRNFGNKNFNNVITSINNNYVNNVILNNNTVDNNRYIDNNKINNISNKNFNIINSYHTKSVSNISDLMYHNKRLISLYKNLSKSK